MAHKRQTGHNRQGNHEDTEESRQGSEGGERTADVSTEPDGEVPEDQNMQILLKSISLIVAKLQNDCQDDYLHRQISASPWQNLQMAATIRPSQYRYTLAL